MHGDDEHRDAAAAAAGSGAGGTSSNSQLGCYGDGSSGQRVRAVYARPEGSTDRYGKQVGAFRSWAAGVSEQFDRSAQATNSRRHVRFATTAGDGCTLQILRVTLAPDAFSSFAKTVDALQKKGLDTPNSKYLVWADADVYCGLGTTYNDDSPGLDNINNSDLPGYARIDRSCWGQVEAHELTHMLGGVQRSAPHSTDGFHCNDGQDVMCYDDHTARSQQTRVCDSSGAVLLDCRRDDYYSTTAGKGSYLQTHWNVARSSFLPPTLSDPPPPPIPPSPSPSPAPTRAPLLPALVVPNLVVPTLHAVPTLAPPSAPTLPARPAAPRLPAAPIPASPPTATPTSGTAPQLRPLPRVTQPQPTGYPRILLG